MLSVLLNRHRLTAAGTGRGGPGRGRGGGYLGVAAAKGILEACCRGVDATPVHPSSRAPHRHMVGSAVSLLRRLFARAAVSTSAAGRWPSTCARQASGREPKDRSSAVLCMPGCCSGRKGNSAPACRRSVCRARCHLDTLLPLMATISGRQMLRSGTAYEMLLEARAINPLVWSSASNVTIEATGYSSCRPLVIASRCSGPRQAPCMRHGRPQPGDRSRAPERLTAPRHVQHPYVAAISRSGHRSDADTDPECWSRSQQAILLRTPPETQPAAFQSAGMPHSALIMTENDCAPLPSRALVLGHP